MVENLIERKRLLYLDYLRVIAIISVLLCHAIETVYSFNADAMKSLTWQSRYFQIAIFTCGRLFGVPIFLMISGYLLLGKKYDDKSIFSFWKNSWLHLIICTMFWFLVYDLFIRYRLKVDLTLSNIIKDMFFLHKVGFGHVWYMPMIIGFYLFIPFVSNSILAISERKVLVIPLLVVFYLSSVLLFINLCLRMLGDPYLESQVSMGFSGGIYGLYILMGFVLKQERINHLKPSKKILLSIIILSSVSVTSYFINACLFENAGYFMAYDFPLTIVGSMSFFVIMMYFEPRNDFINKVVIWLSRYSFAVYLLHMIVNKLFIEIVKRTKLKLPYQVVVIEIIMLLGSYVLAWIISKIPKVGKYILYLK